MGPPLPIPPFEKVNFDAVIRDEKACVTTIGRNHKGEIMFAWTQLTQVQDPLRVEAKATKLSVTKAVEWGKTT